MDVEASINSGVRETGTSSRLTAVEAADLLLHLVTCGKPRAIALEPGTSGHLVHVDDGDGYRERTRLTSSLGDAVVARLAILAELTPGASTSQLGRLRVSLKRPASGSAPPIVELLVAVRVADRGLAAEVHRVATVAGTFTPATVDPVAVPDADFGKYRLDRELGRGGMGVVYLAKHVVLDKPVAVKVLHPMASDNPMLTSQFVIEARAACRARHPGIVDVTDFGTMPDGRAFLVMELVESPTLATVLDGEGPLTHPRVVTLAVRIAEALQAASAHGVVHRDLTPANIFVCNGDQPKICDFGVAKIVDKDAEDLEGVASRVVGTAAYMSPEQGLGEAVDARTDIYALGCVMYRMLTGKVPFAGGSLVAILAKHVHDAPPAMTSPHGPIPAALEGVVLRALAKRPAERYQSPEEMLFDLRRVERVLARGGFARFLPR